MTRADYVTANRDEVVKWFEDVNDQATVAKLKEMSDEEFAKMVEVVENKVNEGIKSTKVFIAEIGLKMMEWIDGGGPALMGTYELAMLFSEMLRDPAIMLFQGRIGPGTRQEVAFVTFMGAFMTYLEGGDTDEGN